MKDELYKIIASNLLPHKTESDTLILEDLHGLVNDLDDFIEKRLVVDKRTDYFIFSLLEDIDMFTSEDSFIRLGSSYRSLKNIYD